LPQIRLCTSRLLQRWSEFRARQIAGWREPLCAGQSQPLPKQRRSGGRLRAGSGG